MTEMSSTEVARCKHPRLGSRFALAAICAILLLPVVALLVFLGLVTLWLFWFILAIWALAEITYAGLIDNHVEVSEHNYPRIHGLAEEVRQNLGLKREISIFVYEQSNFNAWLVKLFRRRAIFLQSEVLETGVTDDEVRWLVGRFIGYLRLQQDLGWFGRLIRITERSGLFTLFILPYSRAMVYTGDRLGLASIKGDIGSALSVMQKMLVGRQLGYSVNPLGIIEQRRRSKGRMFTFLSRLSSPFPSSTARYVDLLVFARREYPDRFAEFEAGIPGIPADLGAISAEHTNGSDVLKAIGIFLTLVLALVVTAFVWPSLVLVGLYNMYAPTGSSFSNPSYDAAEAEYYPYDASENAAGDAMAADAMADDAMAEEPMAEDYLGDTEAAADPYTETNVTCIVNNSGRTISYEMDYKDGNGWQRYNQANGSFLTHYSDFTTQPDIRYDETLNDGVNVERKYYLLTSRSYDRESCGSPSYDFTISGNTIDMVLNN
jgi:hypothetical protein